MVFQCLNPVRSNRIDREMSHLLSTFFGEIPTTSPGGLSRAANVWETDDAWKVEMEIPGVSPDQVEISVIQNEVTISAERTGADEEDRTYFRRERRQGSFTRTLQLPTAVDAEQVEASLVHGVLTVTLPKADAARRRKIQVNG